MSSWDFSGAKWWKFDFHTHTPASNDFMQGGQKKEIERVTPEDWLRRFMEKGIDCVAITDHNSGEWVDRLQDALNELKRRSDKPEWYRPLTLFPGVEISVHGEVHLLAILDPKKSTGDINTLLGKVGYQGEKGTSDTVTDKSLTEVVDKIIDVDGIVIPAHVDRKKGLFKTVTGTTLGQVLGNRNIYSMELCKGFGTFTWVKMQSPTIEGLKLALIDGSESVNRDMRADPNRHAEFVIESITVEHAKYMGHSKKFTCEFSPFLTTIIGGRGSGKSTLLESMRLVLRREGDLPCPLRRDSKKYFDAEGEDALLGAETRLCVIYRKGSRCYRLNWETAPHRASLQEWQATTEQWEDSEGEIRSLFPVRIYSQKQIFELARAPQALISIIDESAKVDREDYIATLRDCKHRCKRNEQERAELEQRIGSEAKLKGERNDLNRQIEQIEQSGHKEVLQTYRVRQRQLENISDIEKHWGSFWNKIEEALETLEIAGFDEAPFSDHREILDDLKPREEKWRTMTQQIEALMKRGRDSLEQWEEEKDRQKWMKSLRADEQAYRHLHDRLERQGIDPETYPMLLQKRLLVEQELQKIGGYRLQVKQLWLEFEILLAKAHDARKALTDRRGIFLQRVLADNHLVQIALKPFAEPWERARNRIQQLLQTQERFNKDIEALGEIYRDSGWEDMKSRILEIRLYKHGAKDQRFQRHLQGLPRESLVNVALWYPEDALEITYGKERKAIASGSPGQKNAALLSFILSYGTEPLLLDQPEDDLDNALISDLIVRGLRETKQKRQIIVVTHNANIVVNGCAEMVHCLVVAGGETHKTSDSLQERSIRKTICDTLEGGHRAFEQRYRRIHLED